MESSVIVLDSDDEDTSVKEISVNDEEEKPITKRPASSSVNGDDGPSKKVRRIHPTKIGEVTKKSSKDDIGFEEQDDKSCSVNGLSLEEDKDKNAEVLDELVEIKPDEAEAGPSTSKTKSGPHENELTPQIKDLIRACRVAETSGDMKKVIKLKLLKYYHSVHPDFVTSKNFVKTLKSTTEEILREPHLVYTKLQLIIEELDARRKSKATVFTNDDSVDVKGTGDEAKDIMLKKLYKALVKIKQHIKDLEEAEVDWDDDEDSAYIKKVRFEKRACDIYEKICEITGESTHAHRIVKKPIAFKGTEFPEFNKKLQKIVNAKNSFPNFLDVLKTLDYCNKKHKFGLVADQLKRVAQDAFEKLGKTLQKRRKDDLYESTTFYIGKNVGPSEGRSRTAKSARKKLKKFYAKYDDIINEYAEKDKYANSDDAEEVSSTSKTEQPVGDSKESVDEKTLLNDDLSNVLEKCEKNGAATTTTCLDDEDDLVILDS